MATTYDNASLVMIPSGVKEDKLYSIKPTDGDGDFTFSRGSDIEATRVNSSGLIEKAKVNLALQSNQFDTTWTTANGASVTGGQTGYDGSSDAWLLEKTATAGAHIVQSITSSGVQSFSVYVKANTLSKITLWANVVGSGNPFAEFDLSTETLSDSSLIVASDISSVGGGWYRVQASFNESITLVRIYVEDFSDTTAGNIYIQDAQLNHGLIAQDYVETTTTAVVEGLTADLPRLDYSGGASCPSLLLEPSRTNLMTQSEYFDSWTQSNANVTSNAGRSPEGVNNASEIEFTSSSAKIYDTFTNVASSLHIGSVWLKNKDIGSIRVRIEGGAPAILGRVDVNLANGTLSNAVGDFTPTIESYADGWYKVAVGDTSNATIASPSFNLDYLSSTGSFYAYGAQVEEGSYPTSLIPTYGTAANRGEDRAYVDSIDSEINESEGTIFLDVEFLELDSGSRISISDGSYTNVFYLRTQSVGKIQWLGGDLLLQTDSGFASANTRYKVAFTYESNNAAMFVNGIKESTDTSFTPAATLDRFGFDMTGAGINEFKGKVNQALIFPTKLTDAEAIALTTI